MNRKPLQPHEVNPKWWEFYRFDRQESFRGRLCILVTCPKCQKQRWQHCSRVRIKNVTPYCEACSRIVFNLKPLCHQDIPEKWRDYYDFQCQELRQSKSRPPTNDLYIRVLCPKCLKKRWVQVSWLRTKKPSSPYCTRCANSTNKGPGSPRWTGGKTIRPDGYIELNIHGLPAEDQELAWPMSRKNNRVAEHRLIMARYLGRPLTNDEIVHHHNSDRQDNRLENLRLTTRCQHWTAPADQISGLITEIEVEVRRLMSPNVNVILLLRYFLNELRQMSCAKPDAGEDKVGGEPQ